MDAVALRKESVDRNHYLKEKRLLHTTSLSARRAWIEIATPEGKRVMDASLSARRAWIEISVYDSKQMHRLVALRKESVDRNLKSKSGLNVKHVALRKESVDRNLRCWMRSAHTLTVALRKESVDRNKWNQLQSGRNSQSLSARRAWIEMTQCRL